MMKDSQGLDISTKSHDLIDKTNLFLHSMVSNGTEAMIIFEIIKEHPKVLLLQCYAGSLYLYGQTVENTKKANEHFKNGKQLLKHSNEREQLIYHAIRAWADQDLILAIKLFTKVLNDYPTDLLSLKYLEWLYYLTGQKYNAFEFLRVCEYMAPHYTSAPHFYSTFSFALELTGRRKEAIDMANRAIDLEPITPWAHHTLSHAYLFEGRIEHGKTILEKQQPSWENILPSLKGHNSWHLGLMYIALGKEKHANETLKHALWKESQETVLVQLDAISYLWRMEMAGLTPSVSWKEIISYIKPHALHAYVPFNTMFFIYACARAKDDVLANHILNNAKAFSSTRIGATAFAWEFIGIPVIKASLAYGNGDYKTACELLVPILHDTPACGGSDAQIEILQEVYVTALIKNKQIAKAKKFFEQHLFFYHNTAIEENWFK